MRRGDALEGRREAPAAVVPRKVVCIFGLLALGGVLAALLCAPDAKAQAPSGAGRKVALVVGNAAYTSLTPLANPLNDAAEVAASLRAVSYDVTLVTDTGLIDLTRAIASFRVRLKGAAVGLFYYSGHGFQSVRLDNHQSVNHIVPVDFHFDGKAGQLPSVPLDTVIDALRTEARVGLVFMDACRDDPLIAAEVKRTAGVKRGVRFGAGLSGVPTTALPAPQARAAVEPGNGPSGILIAYSTDPGNFASDGVGDILSPFTRALTIHMRTPGLSISEIMARVSDDVAKLTKGAQTPWSTSSLTATTYQFSAKPVVAPKPKSRAPPISGISVGAGGIQF